MLPEYARHCATLGRQVEVTLPGGEVLRGAARGLENQGHLVLEKDDGSRVSLAAGEAVVFKAR
jgi:BirA family biotin operon repressor/biotin-[acetyl-CoA-carboxylase] ligase